MKKIKLYLSLSLPLISLWAIAVLVMVLLENLPNGFSALKVIGITILLTTSVSFIVFTNRSFYKNLRSEYREITGKDWIC